MDAGESFVKLSDLLTVPMQRILKYHLFLKVLTVFIVVVLLKVVDLSENIYVKVLNLLLSEHSQLELFLARFLLILWVKIHPSYHNL